MDACLAFLFTETVDHIRWWHIIFEPTFWEKKFEKPSISRREILYTPSQLDQFFTMDFRD